MIPFALILFIFTLTIIRSSNACSLEGELEAAVARYGTCVDFNEFVACQLLHDPIKLDKQRVDCTLPLLAENYAIAVDCINDCGNNGPCGEGCGRRHNAANAQAIAICNADYERKMNLGKCNVYSCFHSFAECPYDPPPKLETPSVACIGYTSLSNLCGLVNPVDTVVNNFFGLGPAESAGGAIALGLCSPPILEAIGYVGLIGAIETAGASVIIAEGIVAGCGSAIIGGLGVATAAELLGSGCSLFAPGLAAAERAACGPDPGYRKRNLAASRTITQQRKFHRPKRAVQPSLADCTTAAALLSSIDVSSFTSFVSTCESLIPVLPELTEVSTDLRDAVSTACASVAEIKNDVQLVAGFKEVVGSNFLGFCNNGSPGPSARVGL